MVISKPSTNITKTNTNTIKPSSKSNTSTQKNKSGGTYKNGGGGSSSWAYDYISDDGSSDYDPPPPPDPRQYYCPLITGPYAVSNSRYYYINSELNTKYSIKDLAVNKGYYSDGTSLSKTSVSYSNTSKQTTSNSFGSKLSDAFNSLKQGAKNIASKVCNFIDENKSNIIKIGIGVGAIAVGAIATVATGGAAAPVILEGLKTAAIVGAASTATSTAFSVGKSLITGEKIDPKSLSKTAVDSFSTGFMIGGILAGFTSTLDAFSSCSKVTSSASNSTNASNSSSSNTSQINSQEAKKASSKVLRNNMIDNGVVEPDYPNAAHHIVAGNSPKAEPARQILQKYGVGINDANNGVFLPTVKDVSSAAYHPGLHTNIYYETVNEMLNGVISKEEVIETLNIIAEKLSTGVFLK